MSFCFGFVTYMPITSEKKNTLYVSEENYVYVSSKVKWEKVYFFLHYYKHLNDEKNL